MNEDNLTKQLEGMTKFCNMFSTMTITLWLSLTEWRRKSRITFPWAQQIMLVESMRR